jgi:tRNA A37 threonylcarbamoyladenosine dehydratase
MQGQFDRIESLLGSSVIDVLKEKKVAIFGIGGVGGYVCEALARSGVGSFVLIDKDNVSITNINRQIIASLDTVGMDKTKVMKDRILSINPNANVEVHNCFFLPENKDNFDFSCYDYVIDAVDTVTAKIAIIMCAKEAKVPVILRAELKKRRINKLKVVYSKEKPLKPIKPIIDNENPKKNVPGSICFVPAAMGLLIASEVIKDLTGIRNDNTGA